MGLIGGAGLRILSGGGQMRDGLPTTLENWQGLFQQSLFPSGVCDIACTWRDLAQGLHRLAVSRPERTRLPVNGGSEGTSLFDGVLPSNAQVAVVPEFGTVVLFD